MRLRTTLIVASAWLCCSFYASAARADSKSDAARLFKEGQDLMKTQKFADACPKFEDSQKLDAQIGTVLNLAFCREKLGSTWLSWLAYRDAELRADSAGKKERADFARQHLAELEKTLPRLVLDCGGDRVDELTVEERLVPGANNGQAFTAEPGHRTFKFTKSGKKPGATEIIVNERGKAPPQHVACPVLESEPVAPTPAPAEPGSGDKPTQLTQTTEPPASRTPAYVSFGVGAVGIAVGSVFGVMTFNAKDSVGSDCVGTTCNASGQRKIDTGKTYGWISTGGFGVAAIGLGLGTYFLLTTPSSASSGNARTTSNTSYSARALGHVVPVVGREGAGAAFFTTF
jgi:hypothetical protein